jgi:phosphohistidine phosphatase SixA
MSRDPVDTPVRAFQRCLLASLFSMLGLSSTGAASLAPKELVDALRTGGYVILMRHASSPRTPPEAASADPDNVNRERQLDENGRASAQAMGAALRRLKIPVGQVLSSPTYRALQTVRLVQLGTPRTYPELGDSGQSMQADASGKRGAWIQARVAMPPPRGTNTAIVTHFPNIAEAFPADGKGLDDGGALILHPDGHGGAAVVARVKIDDWPRWAASQ